MKTRTLICLTVGFVGYGVFLHAARAIGQEPVEPVLPAMPVVASLPAMPPLPAMPHLPAVPAVPHMPAVEFAMPAIPAVPPLPAMPSLGGWNDHKNHGWSTHGDGPVDDCDALRIRLHDERPTIQPEERTISKSEAGVLACLAAAQRRRPGSRLGQRRLFRHCLQGRIGPDTQNLLSQIKLNVKGGEVSVSGPSCRKRRLDRVPADSHSESGRRRSHDPQRPGRLSTT